MKRTLYLMSSGRLRRRQNTLVLEIPSPSGSEGEAGKKKYFPIEQIGEIHAFGELDFNKRLLEFLSKNEVSLHFYSRRGYYVGSFYPREHYNSGYLTLKQAEYYLDEVKRLDLARRFVEGALENMLRVLRYYRNRGLSTELEPIVQTVERQRGPLEGCDGVERLMQAEGQAREAYYRAFDLILQNEAFAFEARTRRPPRNRLNALISFGNSLLYTATLAEIYKTHLDPRIGFLHTTNFRRFTLNLDVAEIFKPLLVDRLVLSMVQRRQIQPKHFEEALEGLYLTEAGRKIFLQAWEERLQTTIHHRGLRRNVSYRRLIRLELYKLEKHLLGEKLYEPFRSRW
ncbi:MAG: CRISPR-associated endonuclease Cas1 2 [Candidatus Tectimicrobiota bacterium]|nr:MAG: CRISPR-associated endonuclease Cas1 2 [Candidatus Tectomicrobia bacterium]